MTEEVEFLRSIRKHLRHTANWRRRLATQYPGDLRNLRAATALDALSEAIVHGAKPEDVRLLERFCEKHDIMPMVAKVATGIGFRHGLLTFPEFIAVLAASCAVAA